MKRVVLVVAMGLFFVHSAVANGGKNERVLINKDANVYIDAHEVTIGEWAQYLEDVKDRSGDNSSYYKELLPDHEACLKAYGTEDYLTNPSFQTYPIVGLTYQQMVAYCGWRTDNVNRTLNAKKSSERYIYSLPTEADLQAAYDLQKDKTAKQTLYCVDVNAKIVTGLIDNVQEMTAEKKIVTGVTSYGLRFEKAPDAPSALIGFRCKSVKQN